ncbi:hypothetical protein BD311DRAFT_788906 [Dichomitus squalens]|uniref:Fungal-type protein kinase domain-containing protein n=1 Tax=Dichomitus squalens TaxID=114155 RepID=A0A4Q9MNW8_9APHY|nr:hypothetical protein BD311DRAFT_788906 [Dichomitus squalens]
MSISTGCLSSSFLCSGGSGTLIGDHDVLKAWKMELGRKINLSDDTGSDFMAKYVPSSTPCTCADVSGTEFGAFKPGEVSAYLSFIKGLNALVASFPDQKRLSFFDCHTQFQRFPYADFAANHHKSYPDIAVSFPGQILDAKTLPVDWSRFSMIIELKTKNEDPFRGKGLKHCKTLIQLAVDARNLLHAHSLLAAFIVGVYGDTVRIARFDHAGAVFSQPLSLREVDDLRIIQRFFWNFAHPNDGETVVGWDPTVRRLTPDDEEWLKHRLELAGVSSEEFLSSEARRAEVFNDDVSGNAGVSAAYILFKALDVNGRLFSRATTVWLGIRDTRSLVNGRLVDLLVDRIPAEDLKVRIVKDAWRPVVRRSEKDSMPVCQAYLRLSAWGFLVSSSVGIWESVSHMRFVVDIIGRPLTRFRNTREMASAIRDGIRGHRVAVTRAGILHRDVSVNNILIVDDPAEQGSFTGFIHDFDYSSMSRDFPTNFTSAAALSELLTVDVDGGEPKERVGTFHFMSIELVAGSVIPSSPLHHDLQSFYWVLLWIALRHTDHTHPMGDKACPSIFQLGDANCVSAKLIWLHSPIRKNLSVRDNVPLTVLLKELGDLCLGTIFRDNNPLHYEDVLAVFDKVLDSEGYRSLWPAEDPARAYKLPDTRRKNKLSSSGTDMDDESTDFEPYDEDHKIRMSLAGRDGSGKLVGAPNPVSLIKSEPSFTLCSPDRNYDRCMIEADEVEAILDCSDSEDHPDDASDRSPIREAKRRKTAVSGTQASTASTKASTTLVGTSEALSGSTLTRRVSMREPSPLSGSTVNVESWRGPASNTRFGGGGEDGPSQVQPGRNERNIPQATRGHVARMPCAMVSAAKKRRRCELE